MRTGYAGPAFYMLSCRSSDLPRSVRLPTHSGAVALAVLDIPVLRAYSSGSVQDSHLIPY